MTDQIYSPHDLDNRLITNDRSSALVNRRKFLITSFAGTTGLMLFPFQSAQASPVFWAVARFAASIAAPVIANLISDYLRQRTLSTSGQQQVSIANNRMAQGGGFSDLSRSTVYVPRGEQSYFFYPARNVDLFNTCVAFLDDRRSSGSELIALVEGPTLFGIGELASTLAGRNSPETVRRTLLPRNTVYAGRGTIDRGYDRDDVLSTDSGTVRAHYTTNGHGRGTVTVEAHNERGTLLAGGDYDLTYTSA